MNTREKSEMLAEFKQSIDSMKVGEVVNFGNPYDNYWGPILRHTCLFVDLVSHNGKKGPSARYFRTEKSISHDEFFAALKMVRSDRNRRSYDLKKKREQEKPSSPETITVDPDPTIPKNVPLVFMTESEYTELQNTTGNLAKKVDDLNAEISSLRKQRNDAFDEVKDLTAQNRLLEATIKDREKRFFQTAKKADTNWIQDFRR